MKVHDPNPQLRQLCRRVRASAWCVPRLPNSPIAVPDSTVCQEEPPILARTPRDPAAQPIPSASPIYPLPIRRTTPVAEQNPLKTDPHPAV